MKCISLLTIVLLSFSSVFAALPAAPVVVARQVSGTSNIELSYSEKSVVTGFYIFRSDGTSWITLANVKTLSYIDSTSQVGKTYNYQVGAYNASGETDSASVSFSVAVPTYPGTLAIAAPVSGATLTGPVSVSATFSPCSGIGLNLLQIIDNNNTASPLFSSSVCSINQSFTLSLGTHQLTIRGLNNLGVILGSRTVTVNVAPLGRSKGGTLSIVAYFWQSRN